MMKLAKNQMVSSMSMSMDLPSGRVLVTGALGQIVTELVEALRKKHGHEAVIATDIRKAEGCQILNVMEKEEIKEFLNSKEGGQETADEEMSFIEKSIGAVPTYFINNQYIIQGGQEPETFVSFLNKILVKEKENALPK